MPPDGATGETGWHGRDSLDVVDAATRDRWVLGPEVSAACLGELE